MAEKIVAMVLAGGKGTRLKELTKKTAKPAVGFAGKYRIIDFPISNCSNSDIHVVGVLTQYESTDLDSYIGNGEKWGLNGARSKTTTLSPRQTEEGSSWYEGTADAITKNIDFIDSFSPEHVLILSGDHIYKTSYKDMIYLHRKSNADATISVIEVPMEEAPRFGIMVTDENDFVTQFQEKPKKPMSNLASMGVYIFKWETLRAYLKKDEKNKESSHDFGNDIIPQMLKDKRIIKVYRFKGYWKDVGTLESLHQANMDIALAKDGPSLYDHDLETRIYTEDTPSVPQYVGPNGSIRNSIANQGSVILGTADECVIHTGAVIKEGAVCRKVVLLNNAIVEEDCEIENAIIASGVRVKRGEKINIGTGKVILIAK